MTGQTGKGFGAYGKVPALGDFFRTGLPGDFIEPWDDWLQRLLLECRRAYDARFEEAYMSAPIWRFSLAAGLAGPRPMLGVVMNSVDRVGRMFPLTLAAPLGPETDPVACHLCGDETFLRLEEAALDALEDGRSKADLEAALEEIALPPPPMPGAVRSVGATLTAQAGAGASCLAASLARGPLTAGRRHPSLWSCEVDGVARLMACDGLPGGREMIGLMSLSAPIWTEAA